MELRRRQLLEQIMLSMGKLHRSFATTRDGFLAQFSLSRPQMDLLMAIKHCPLSTGDIAKRFAITSSAVSQMVDQLESKKLVERVASQTDKRVSMVKLAGETHKVFEDMRNKFVDHLDLRFASISNQEFETLLDILNKTVDQISQEN